ncbi:S8 family serine peptidase [Paenibacillus larvae]|uniref:S8 family peptidase n=1 Tax=Paenibacillus larvae TaxID=1464 RepID=UPI00227F4BD7|nr:S8 family serine peptidase [Paenibacillus larvae]MCY9510031.1 S8 family serine peptidase [Paenibacillus larvae]MCY9527318.1 S8 family serine peptidase [Paenibacillus larvae]
MKRMMLRLAKSLIIIMTTIVLLTFTSNHYLSANDAQKSQRAATHHQIIVIKDKHHAKPIIKKITKKFPALKLDFIKEIGVIQIEHHEKEVIDKAIKYIHTKYRKYIVQESEVTNPFDLDTMLTNQSNVDSNGPPRNLQGDPNVYYWQWGVNYVTEDKKSYSIAKGSNNVTIAILDSGIDMNHPDLVDNIVSPGRSFVPGEPTTMDYVGHGTEVAGIIAANGNIMGVGPEIGIVPYKIFSREGGRAFWMIKAIVEATNDRHKVLNISAGIYQSYNNKTGGAIVEAFRRAVDYANNRGSIIVNSAGNEGYNIDQIIREGEDDREVIRLPSVLPNVTTVGASTLERVPSPYSNYGTKVDLYAPGGSYGAIGHEDEFDLSFLLLTTYPTYLEQSAVARMIGLPQGYDLDIGTSLATPAVAATYALVIQKLNEQRLIKTPRDIADIVMETTVPLRANDSAGRSVRMVNAYKALQYIENKLISQNDGKF